MPLPETVPLLHAPLRTSETSTVSPLHRSAPSGVADHLDVHAALRLAESGATVVMAGRSTQRLSDAAERIRSRVPSAMLECMQLDLASLESVRDFAKAFEARHSRLDVLVNNAGLSAIPG